MYDDEPYRRPRRRRLTYVFLAALLALAVLAAGATAFVGAVSLGYARPPGFAVTVGRTTYAAPCPPEMGCDPTPPFYAIWEGRRNSDGSINYRLRYFTYLRRRKDEG